MIFKAKVDTFYVVSTVLELLIIVALAILPLYFESFRSELITVFMWLALFIITIALILWASFSIKYVFEHDHLFVKGGPFKSRIPYENITKILRTKEIFTGYKILSSRDGLEIIYTNSLLGSVKVSPENKKEFIHELNKRCAILKIDL